MNTAAKAFRNNMYQVMGNSGFGETITIMTNGFKYTLGSKALFNDGRLKKGVLNVISNKLPKPSKIKELNEKYGCTCEPYNISA